MKFRSPTDEPLHVALTTGHTCTIPPEGVDLDPMFQREAISRGALTGDEVEQPSGDAPQFDRKHVITDAINGMMDGDNEADFNEDGKPNLTRLKALVGFNVARAEVDAIFDELTAGKE